MDKSGKWCVDRIHWMFHCVNWFRVRPISHAHPDKFILRNHVFFDKESTDDIEFWESLVSDGYAKKLDEREYCLTPDGVLLLGNLIGFDEDMRANWRTVCYGKFDKNTGDITGTRY